MKAEQLHLPLGIFRLVQCSAASAGDPNHHLRRKASGYWQLRVTVDRGRKFVGQRVILGLKTRCEREARERRDVILTALEKARLVAGASQ